jgi:hypothetical protein
MATQCLFHVMLLKATMLTVTEPKIITKQHSKDGLTYWQEQKHMVSSLLPQVEIV